jgi:hypothetical protein
VYCVAFVSRHLLAAGKYTPDGPRPTGPRGNIYSGKIKEIQPLISLMRAVGEERGKSPAQVRRSPQGMRTVSLSLSLSLCVCVRVCVCVCVRACVRACVRVRVYSPRGGGGGGARAGEGVPYFAQRREGVLVQA